MAKARKLIRSEAGPPVDDVVSGRCSVCHRPFEITAVNAEDQGRAVQELRALFEVHVCDEDANPAAARIVRKTTGRE